MVVNTNNAFEELFATDDPTDWGSVWGLTIGSYLGQPDSSDFHITSGVAHAEVGWAARYKNASTTGSSTSKEMWEALASDVQVLTAGRVVSTVRVHLQAPLTSQQNQLTLILESGEPYDSSEYVGIVTYGPDLVGIEAHTGAWSDNTTTPTNGPFYSIYLADYDVGWQYVNVATAWTDDWYYIEIDRRGGDGHRETYLRVWKDGDTRPSDPTLTALNSGLLFTGSPTILVAGSTNWNPTSTSAVSYVGAGAMSAGTGAIAPALPAGLLTGDLMILAVETSNESVTTPTGWTLRAASGIGTAGSSAAVRLTYFWKRYVVGDAAPNVADPGDHAVGRVFAWRNATLGANYDGGRAGSVGTSHSLVMSEVTSADNATMVALAGLNIDSNSAQLSGWADANITGLTEVVDDFSNQGNGGGIGMATGTIATAGTGFGTLSFTSATSSDYILEVFELYDDYAWEFDESFVVELTAVEAQAAESVFQPYGRNLHILSIRASFTDDNLYNHALVVASGDKDNIYYGEVRDDDPGSPTNIADIGDRVFKYESDLISTQAAADQAAMATFLANCLISEDVDMDNVCVPMLEGNDVIAVQELNFSELNQTFRVRSLTIPLSNSRQTMKFGRVIAL